MQQHLCQKFNLFYTIILLLLLFFYFNSVSFGQETCSQPQNGNLISNPDFQYLTGVTNPDKIYIFDRNFGCKNPWLLVCGWNLYGPGDWNLNEPAEIQPNLATPDIFRSEQSGSCNTGKLARIYPCSTNVNGTQRPFNFCNGICNQFLIPTFSYAGIGYVFSYDVNNKLKKASKALKYNYYEQIYQWSEYLTQRSSAPLVQNHVYKITIQISKADGFNDFENAEKQNYNFKDVNLKYIGALFTTSNNKIEIPSQAYETESIDADKWNNIVWLNTETLDEKGSFGPGPGGIWANRYDNKFCHWTTITGYFKACKSGLQYLYIGHFNEDIREEIGDAFECGQDISYTSYYYIGNVELKDVSLGQEPAVTDPYCQSSTYCSCDNVDYDILTTSILPDKCDKEQCYTKISIQKRGSWNCPFNFVKLNIHYQDSKDENINELIQITPQQKTNFDNGAPIDIYTVGFNYDQVSQTIFTHIDIYSQIFNDVSICNPSPNDIISQHPGWWGNEISKNGVDITCKCLCDDIHFTNNIQFIQDQNDPCCYTIRIDNTQGKCDLNINKIGGVIMEIQDNYSFNFIPQYEQNSYFVPNNFTILNNKWSVNSPFWDNSNGFGEFIFKKLSKLP